MRFEALPLQGAFLVHRDPFEDERGYFSRAFSVEEFQAQGLVTTWAQSAGSWNHHRGTLRGLHYQLAPAEEAKLIFCVRGEVFDVMVDLREGSPTRNQWWTTTLTERDHRMVYIPEGFAHGYQSLCDDAEIFYQMSAPYRPELSRGIRWDDPRLGIPWPVPPTVMSDRDRSLPLLER